MSLSSFKNFVKERPSLINHVESGKKTWQDFYNIYELYGENSSVWDKYLEKGISSTAGVVTFKDLFDTFKNMDVSGVQDSLTSLQKGINYISNIVKEKEGSIPKRSSYERRPIYKYFDD